MFLSLSIRFCLPSHFCLSKHCCLGRFLPVFFKARKKTPETPVPPPHLQWYWGAPREHHGATCVVGASLRCYEQKKCYFCRSIRLPRVSLVSHLPRVTVVCVVPYLGYTFFSVPIAYKFRVALRSRSRCVCPVCTSDLKAV